MSTWYRVGTGGFWSGEVKKFEVLRETERCVFTEGFSGREDRHSKVTADLQFYRDRNEAYKAASAAVRKKIDGLNARIEKLQTRLAEIEYEL